MKSKVMLSLLVLWLLSTAVTAAAEDDFDKLQGTWKVTKAVRRGKPDDEAKQIVVIVKGNRITFKLGDKPEIGGETTTFKIDPSKNLKTIDFADPDKPERIRRIGIYVLEGDTLKMCFVRAKEDRPTEFELKSDSRGYLIECTRN